MKYEGMESAASGMIDDLSLLFWLYVAHFIVWRTIRTLHHERMARLKSLRVVDGRGPASAGEQFRLRTGIDEKGMLREVLVRTGFRDGR